MRRAGRYRHAATRSAVLLLAVAVAACTSAAPAANAPPPLAAGAPPNLFDTQREIDGYISSGRYDADMSRVAQEAQAYLEQRAGAVVKPAIVLDIDETSLSNWPAYKANGWARILNGPCDLVQGPCGIRTWQSMAQSKALPATLALARRAKALGVAVFFISARPAAMRAATERNLRQEGYDNDGLTIYAEGAHYDSAADFKAPERKRIAERGYTILLTLGDQESDLTGGYAERAFKLPNPVYRIP
jgi:predicted secreted acid phosphatase